MTWRVGFAWVVYPALVAGTFAALTQTSFGWPTVFVLALPSALTSAVVRRGWMYAVPVVWLGGLVLVGLAAGSFECAPDVSCEDDPQTLAAMLLVLGGGISLAGLLVGDVVGRLSLSLRAAASPGS